jgi:hypothetical protein
MILSASATLRHRLYFLSHHMSRTGLLDALIIVVQFFRSEAAD